MVVIDIFLQIHTEIIFFERGENINTRNKQELLGNWPDTQLPFKEQTTKKEKEKKKWLTKLIS